MARKERERGGGSETYVSALDVILVLLNLLLQVVKTNLVILNDQVDLKLLDTETNSNQSRGSPDKTVYKTKG